MFNGVILSRKSAPPYLAWLLDFSPFNLSMESILYYNYGSDIGAWDRLVTLQGFQKPRVLVDIGRREREELSHLTHAPQPSPPATWCDLSFLAFFPQVYPKDPVILKILRSY